MYISTSKVYKVYVKNYSFKRSDHPACLSGLWRNIRHGNSKKHCQRHNGPRNWLCDFSNHMAAFTLVAKLAARWTTCIGSKIWPPDPNQTVEWSSYFSQDCIKLISVRKLIMYNLNKFKLYILYTGSVVPLAMGTKVPKWGPMQCGSSEWLKKDKKEVEFEKYISRINRERLIEGLIRELHFSN